ncbi:polyhydroxyalkanoic acid system family protein [Parablastomonas sp. CN1-191]|uniref:polyhydroxyalkanoic acid system family protein n=1 Tax=Parablastomonas sp. CN1-191 TaxID=3400908 RepID=UPI003BF81141
MRFSIPHSLGKDEVRRRLDARKDELAGHIPGGMAEVHTEWVDQDRLRMAVGAMGQQVNGMVTVEDHAMIYELDLPPALSFVEPIIRGAIEKNTRKLLT